MPLKSKRSPAEGEFLFEIDEEPTDECLTALGGLPLFLRTARSLDVAGSVKRNLALKQRDRGFDEATYIESFLALNAAGGDCLDDFDCLREDRGVAAILGHEVPSPEAARKFLYQFHGPEKIEQAQRNLPMGEVSYVPEESAPLRGLAQVNQDVVRELARRCAGERIATVDMDATVIESWKREAKATYEGGCGYQPDPEGTPCGVGGDERGGGRGVSRRQRAGPERPATGSEAGVFGAARDDPGTVLPRGFGVR